MEDKEVFNSYFDMRFLDSEREVSIEIPLDPEPEEKEVTQTAAFKIKAMFPKDRTTVDLIVSRKIGGVPRSSCSADQLYRLERDAWINVAVVESPPWWKSPSDCPSEDFLDRLFQRIYEHNQDFQEKLKKNRLPARESK